MKYILIFVSTLLILLIGLVIYLMINSSSTSSKDFSYLNKPYTVSNSVKKIKDINNLYAVDRIMTNVLSDSRRRILKVDIVLELSSEESKDILDNHKSILRDKLIRVITTSKVSNILNSKGKDKLKEKIIKQVNTLFASNEVKDCYFSEFVIQ